MNDAGLEVRTPNAQWSYAASFDVDGRLGATPTMIHVKARVLSGLVGIGCLDTAGTAFLDEQFVGSSDRPAHLTLVVGDPAAASRIVIRNAAPETASCVRVLDIWQEPLTDRDNQRDPPLTKPGPSVDWNRFYGTTGETPIERLRVQRFTALAEPLTIEWTDGMRFRVYPGDQLSRALYVSGTYEPDTLTVLSALIPRGGVVFDVGANAGVVTIAAASWVGLEGQVFSIEPSSREFIRLVENVELNGLRVVHCIRAAACDREGRITLRVAAGGYGGLNTVGARFAYDGVATDSHEQVDAVSLDALVTREQIHRVDVLKIDVEGAEGAVLVGARQLLHAHRPAIVLEVFSRSLAENGWDRARLASELRSAGYHMFRLDAQAVLTLVPDLESVDEGNVVALPRERATRLAAHVESVALDRG